MDIRRCSMTVMCKLCPDERTCDGVIKEPKYYKKIIIDYKLDNWNDTINSCRRNKYGANNKKQKEMAIISHFLVGVKPIKKYPIRINCIWHVVNMGSDLDNKSLKSVLDQMQKSGILENDNCRHIREINHKVVKDKKDYLEIDIREI